MVSPIWDRGTQVPPVAGPRLTSRAWDGTGGLRRAQEEVGASGPSRGQVGCAGVVGALPSRGHSGDRGEARRSSRLPTWRAPRVRGGGGRKARAGGVTARASGPPRLPRASRVAWGWAGECLPCPAPSAARCASVHFSRSR